MNNWRILSLTDPDQLREARGALHRAVQLVAAVGRTFSAKAKDDHFATLFWSPQQEMLIGHPVQGKFELKAGLRIKDFSIHLLDQDHQIETSFGLNQKTQGQAMVWMEEQLAKAGFQVKQYTLELPYRIPDYPPVKGKPFQLKAMEGLQEYANYFHNSYYLLSEIGKRFSETTQVQTWPHHFDMGMQIILNDTGDPETSTSIGAGFSPGDKDTDEPYFYINTWPYPPIDQLGDPPGLGRWITEDWVGATLKSSALLRDQQHQKNQIEQFFKTAIGRFHELLKDT